MTMFASAHAQSEAQHEEKCQPLHRTKKVNWWPPGICTIQLHRAAPGALWEFAFNTLGSLIRVRMVNSQARCVCVLMSSVSEAAAPLCMHFQIRATVGGVAELCFHVLSHFRERLGTTSSPSRAPSLLSHIVRL